MPRIDSKTLSPQKSSKIRFKNVQDFFCPVFSPLDSWAALLDRPVWVFPGNETKILCREPSQPQVPFGLTILATSRIASTACIALQNRQTNGRVSKRMCSQDAGVPWLGTRPLVRNGLASLRREISENFILGFAKHDPAKQLTKVAWPPKKSMIPECLSAQPRLEAALAQLFLKHLTCGISTSSSHQHVDRHLARHRHHRTCG